MTSTTKGGRPKTRANANPEHNRCFTVYCYKTFGGRTEIRLVNKKQEPGRTRWRSVGEAEIIKSATAAATRVTEILSAWDTADGSNES